MSMLYKNVWRVCLSGVCMLVKENYCTQELLSLLMFKAWNKMLSFFSILFLFVFSFFILKMTLG